MSDVSSNAVHVLVSNSTIPPQMPVLEKAKSQAPSMPVVVDEVKLKEQAPPMPVPAAQPAQQEISNELVVPLPPLSRSQTRKAEPENMHTILSICGHALKNFGQAVISASTILLVLQKVIQAAQAISKLNGDDLKQICMDSVHWLIEHVTNVSDSEKDTLDILSEKAFSQTFDMIVAVEKIEEGCLACFCKK